MAAIVDPFREQPPATQAAPAAPAPMTLTRPPSAGRPSPASTPRATVVDPFRLTRPSRPAQIQDPYKSTEAPTAERAATEIRRPGTPPERSLGEAALDRGLGIGAAGLDMLGSTVAVSNQRTPWDDVPGGAPAFAALETAGAVVNAARNWLPEGITRRVDASRQALTELRAADPANTEPRSEFAAAFADRAHADADAARAAQSPKEQATRERLAAVQEEGFVPTLKELVSNPSALATATDSLVPSLAAGGGAAKLAGRLVGLGAAGQTATQLGTMAGIEGADAAEGAYRTVMEAPQEQLAADPMYAKLVEAADGDHGRAREALAQTARAVAGSAGTTTSLLLQGLSQRLGFNVVENTLLGQITRAGGSRVRNAVVGAGREFVGEAAEGAANQLSQNLGAMAGAAETDLTRGVGGAAAIEGAAGFAAGGVMGAAQPTRAPATTGTGTPGPTADPAPSPVADAMASRLQRPVVPFPTAQPGSIQDAANTIAPLPVQPADSVPVDASAPPSTQSVVAAPQEAAPPTALIDPDARARAAFDARLQEASKGMPPDQVERMRALFEAPARDRVTGLHRSETLRDTLDAAHGQSGSVPAVYVEADLANLGGLNARLGNSGADRYLRDMAETIRTELEALGAAVGVRKGGDEFGFVVQGVEQQAVDQAMSRARQRFAEATTEFADLPHTKAGGAAGVGLHFGTARILPDRALSETVAEADRLVELRKKGGRYGLEGTAQTIGSGSPAGRPVDGGAGTPGRRGPGESGGSAVEVPAPDGIGVSAPTVDPARAGRRPEGAGVPAAQPDRDSEGARPAARVTAPAQSPDVDRVDPTAAVTLQNRDRNRAASVQQMQSIANAPDSARLSFSRDPGTGAPMVFVGGDAETITAADLGKRDEVTMPSGRKIPVQYAVVEADTVLASNRADGTRVEGYYQPVQPGHVRALNNGRTAGIQAAFNRGTTDRYVEGLIADAAVHGVPAEAIRSKQRPMLVRVYPERFNTGDIGAESNKSQALGLGATEQAESDARALPDLTGLAVGEDGDLFTAANRAFVIGWMRNLGQTDAASLVDASGAPNKQAGDRLRAAIFTAAYRDPRLTSAMAEEANPDIKNILSALTMAAPDFARIDPEGPLGMIASQIGEAVSAIRDAKNRGVPVNAMGDMFNQRPGMVENLADRISRMTRAPRRLADLFREVARFVATEQQAGTSLDMFGRAPMTYDDVTTAVDRHLERQHEANRPAASGSLFNAAGRPAAASPSRAVHAGRDERPAGSPDTGGERAPEGQRRAGPRVGDDADAGPLTIPIEEGEAVYGTPSPLSAGTERREPGGHAVAQARTPDGALPGRTGQFELFTPEGRPVPRQVAVASRSLARVALVSTGRFSTGFQTIDDWTKAAHVIAPIRKSPQETLVALALDAEQRPLAVFRHTLGQVAGAEVEPWSLLGAVSAVPGIRSVYFAHNHPSGRVTASQADRTITRTLVDALRGSGIEAKGMLIVGPGSRHATLIPAEASGGVSPDLQDAVATASRSAGAVPEVGRVFRTIPKGTRLSISDPEAAERAVREWHERLGEPEVGALLLDTFHSVAGGISMTARQARKLRSGDPEIGAAAVFRAMHEANAAQVIVWGDEWGARNLAALPQAIGTRTLDRFTLRNGRWQSAAASGAGIADPAFFSARAAGKRATRPLEPAKVEALVARHTAEWTNGPRVHVVKSPDQLPDEALRKEGLQTAEGFIDNSRDVWLVADNLSSPRRVVQVLAHEAVGHFGIDRVLGPTQWKRIEGSIWKLREQGKMPELFAEIADRYEREGPLGRKDLAREAIAVMAEKGAKDSLLDRVIAAVRAFLRKWMPNVQWTPAELRQLLVRSERLLRQGEPVRDRVRRMGMNDEAPGTPTTVPLDLGKVVQAAQGLTRKVVRKSDLRNRTDNQFGNSAIPPIDSQVSAAASEAATSPTNSLPEPTPAQKEAGNYKKGHVRLNGLDISIENPAGSKRRPEWPALKHHYGYIRGTVGRDKDHIDVFLTENAGDTSRPVFVIDQRKEDGTSFDEVKVILGESTVQAAKEAYLSNYPKGWNRLGAVTKMTQEEFKAWAADPAKTRMPASSGRKKAGKPAPPTAGNLTVRAPAGVLSPEGESGVESGNGQETPAPRPVSRTRDLRLGRGGPRAVESRREAVGTVDRGEAGAARQGDESKAALREQSEKLIARARVEVIEDASNAETDGGRFSRGPTIPEHVTPAQREALSKIGSFATGQSLSESARRGLTRWREKLAQGIFDQFHPLKKLDAEGYMQARLSRGTDGALEALFLHGRPVLRQGAFDVVPDGKGVRGLLASLNGEHDLFLAWIAGNRAARLRGEGRERLFSDAEIRALQALDQGTMADGRDRRAAYRAAHAEFNAYQKAVLDIGEQAGLFSSTSRAEWQQAFYVPFYREMSREFEPAAPGGSEFSESGTAQVVKTLEGGPQPLGDLLSNTLENWSRILTASMRNLAASKALAAAVREGIAKRVEVARPDTHRVMRDGAAEHFEVADPLLADALTMLHFNGETNRPMQVLGAFKRALSVGVTISPSFRIRNLLRDTLSAMAVTDTGYNPVRNIVDGWNKAKEGTPTFQRLLASGGAVRFGTLNDGAQSAYAKRLIGLGIETKAIVDTPAKAKHLLQAGWEWWKQVGDRVETVNRAVIYQRAIARGATHLEAAYESRDLLDFTMGGKWAAVRFLAQTVPFLNARLQGTYKLGRGAVEKPDRFAAVAGALALASAALYLLQKDDEEYRALPDWARDTYWCVGFGGQMWFIPKPFEVGALGSIVERGTELAVTGDDYQARDFARTLTSIAVDQLAMNPTPQAVKPLLEVLFNRDTFRGRPIDSMGQDRLPPEDRFTARTSAPAVGVGKALNVSPQRIEHLVRGYFGWLGLQVLNVADIATRPLTDLPSNPARNPYRVQNWPVVGDFVRSPEMMSSKYVDRFYEVQRQNEQLYAAFSAARAAGDIERAMELEGTGAVRLRKVHTTATRQMLDLNRQIRMANRDPALDPKQKDALLQGLYRSRNELAEFLDRQARAN